MNVLLMIRNESTRKRMYRSADLRRLAVRVCEGENLEKDAEVGLLLCDDPFIAELNGQYRKVKGPTDVLSFSQRAQVAQQGPFAVLGDVIISLETVERRCRGNSASMRDEVRMLFCHGLLHLLGLTHDSDARRERMFRRQAGYLDMAYGDMLNAISTGRVLPPSSMRRR